MKVKLLVIVILLFVSTSFVIAAESEPPKPVLKPGDVKHFIKTYPLLVKDLEKYGMKYEAKAGNVTVPEALKASEEFREILKKHGWDEQFWHKFATIAMGYAFIQYGKGIKEADPKIAKAIKEIENNSALSEQMKAQLKQQLTAVKGVMKAHDEQLKTQVHKEDMDLIRPLVNELKTVMENK